MSLSNFDASGGDLAYLENAWDKAILLLEQGHTLDLQARFSAGVVALVASCISEGKASWFNRVSASNALLTQ